MSSRIHVAVICSDPFPISGSLFSSPAACAAACAFECQSVALALSTAQRCARVAARKVVLELLYVIFLTRFSATRPLCLSPDRILDSSSIIRCYVGYNSRQGISPSNLTGRLARRLVSTLWLLQPSSGIDWRSRRGEAMCLRVKDPMRTQKGRS